MAGTDHWNSKLSKNIQSEKNDHSAFLIFQKLIQNINKNINYISGIFWSFKSKLQIIYRLLTLHCFFLSLITVFSCLVRHIHICLYYFLVLCFRFHLLFHAFLVTRRILQFTMLDPISLQHVRNITEIKSTTKEKVTSPYL